jgi:hypothetical protein
MKRSSIKRYCVDRGHIKSLERDGIGWGYDLDSGCFMIEDQSKTRTIHQKIKEFFK